jgi:hypothetical protein
MALASFCSRINRTPFTPRIAYWLGIIITVLRFLFPDIATPLPSL